MLCRDFVKSSPPFASEALDDFLAAEAFVVTFATRWGGGFIDLLSGFCDLDPSVSTGTPFRAEAAAVVAVAADGSFVGLLEVGDLAVGSGFESCFCACAFEAAVGFDATLGGLVLVDEGFFSSFGDSDLSFSAFARSSFA